MGEFRFLLAAVNAKYIHSNPAIYSLRAYVPKADQTHVQLAEYTINQSLEEILADIYRHRPDAIGLSCYLWNWKLVQELLAELPKLLPKASIWLGGPEVSFHAQQILQTYPQITGIMIGEGEETFREILAHYLRGEKTLSQIAGLCLPEGYTAHREPMALEDLPFLYGDLQGFENRILYYESSRGCPYRCSYCLSAIDKRVRLRRIETVFLELQFFLDHRVKQVKFVDRTFNCDHAHAMAIWQYLEEHDNGVTNFHFEIAADILREEALVLLNRLRPGLVQLEIGVQSTNPQTIRELERVMDVDKLERIVERIRRSGNIHQHLDLIAGLPYEDLESFARSFDRVYAMRPHQLQLGFLKVLKGSPMEERADRYGIRYLDSPPYEVLCTNWISYEDILLLKQVEEMVEIYYNSGQFVHTLAFLEQAFTGAFLLYRELALFYAQRGYFVRHPARSYRYQVLLEFARVYDAGYDAVYTALLTYDLYLRENAKSRPEFAPVMSQDQKAFARAFYQREEKERRYLPMYAAYDSRQLAKMTHLEAFAYPVWDAQKMARVRSGGAREGEGGYLLFAYHKRDPLTGEALTIPLGGEEQR